ncbi:MAG: hypothetical protein M3P06_23065 [Acidobacteriota bacterium]|nr:hypothetical protein [Acidobacteriota bacterium]
MAYESGSCGCRTPKRLWITLMLLLVTPLASAQIVTSTNAGVVVAHDGKIELPGRWTTDGVMNATAIATTDDRVAVLDALANEAVIVELATGRASRIKTAETPITAAFLGRELYILARDARVLQHGAVRISIAADPSFLGKSNGKLFVYSRTTGTLEEIDRDRVSRRTIVAPFASDLEISGTTAYLVYPRDARIRIVDLVKMQAAGEIAVGAVPVDLAFAGGGTALTARVLAVADPSAKRVWLQEGAQSMTQAIARGVLRGFLGLGLFGSRASQFPTGVDRVLIRGKVWIAYDSSSGTLYRFTKRTSSIVARNVAPQAFTVTADGVAWWNGTSVARMALR